MAPPVEAWAAARVYRRMAITLERKERLQASDDPGMALAGYSVELTWSFEPQQWAQFRVRRMKGDEPASDYFLRGTVRWTGCSEVEHCGAALHFCDWKQWLGHLALMAYLHRRAHSLMDGGRGWPEQAGDAVGNYWQAVELLREEADVELEEVGTMWMPRFAARCVNSG